MIHGAWLRVHDLWCMVHGSWFRLKHQGLWPGVLGETATRETRMYWSDSETSSQGIVSLVPYAELCAQLGAGNDA